MSPINRYAAKIWEHGFAGASSCPRAGGYACFDTIPEAMRVYEIIQGQQNATTPT